MNEIFNIDCIEFMNSQEPFADVVITSPPYNTSRKSGKLETSSIRYINPIDTRTNEEYIQWSVDVFNGFDKILKPNGCVCYNMSIGGENTTAMFLTIAEIIKQTNFTIADTIVWKKQSALPNNVSTNKLTRICEYVFVFCRKDEFNTFHANKECVSVRENGQKMYETLFNYIEAPNNDENCPIHKATYSSMLVRKLINLYAPMGGVIFDPFMGTGTTAIGALMENRKYVGTELIQEYAQYAKERIKHYRHQLTLF